MSEFGDSLRPVGDFTEVDGYGYYDPVLLHESLHARLYRIKKAGKQFIIKTPINNDAFSIELLKREYDISLSLSHPNIASVFTYENTTPVGPGIIMEFVQGERLDDYLMRSPSLSSLKKIFSQLLDAVGYLHKSSVVHNDLKPSNILVTRVDGDLKLIDFGLSDNDAYYMLKTLGCTPAFASPELKAQSGVVDGRSDIYSIGILMKEIFGRKYSSVSEKCCQHNPDNRYADIDQLRNAWNNLQRRPKRLLMIVATVAVMVAIAIPSILYFSQRGMLAQNEAKYSEAISKINEEKLQQKNIAQAVDSIINKIYLPLDSVLISSTYRLSHLEIPNTFLSGTSDLVSKVVNDGMSDELRAYASSYSENQKYVAHEKLKLALEKSRLSMLNAMLDQYKKEVHREYLLTKDSITAAPDLASCASMPSNFLARQSIIFENIKNMTDDQNLYSEFYLKAVEQYYTPYFEKIYQLYSSKH